MQRLYKNILYVKQHPFVDATIQHLWPNRVKNRECAASYTDKSIPCWNTDLEKSAIYKTKCLIDK